MAKANERVRRVANHKLRMVVSLLTPLFGYVRIISTIVTLIIGAMFGVATVIGGVATKGGASEVYLRTAIAAGMLQVIMKYALLTTISAWILWLLFWYVCVGNRTLSQWVGYHELDKKGNVLYRTPEYSWDGHELRVGDDGKRKKLPAPEGGIPQIQHSIQEVAYIGTPFKIAIEAVRVHELGSGGQADEDTDLARKVEAEKKGKAEEAKVAEEKAESTEELGDTEGKGE